MREGERPRAWGRWVDEPAGAGSARSLGYGLGGRWMHGGMGRPGRAAGGDPRDGLGCVHQLCASGRFVRRRRGSDSLCRWSAGLACSRGSVVRRKKPRAVAGPRAFEERAVAMGRRPVNDAGPGLEPAME